MRGVVPREELRAEPAEVRRRVPAERTASALEGDVTRAGPVLPNALIEGPTRLIESFT